MSTQTRNLLAGRIAAGRTVYRDTIERFNRDRRPGVAPINTTGTVIRAVAQVSGRTRPELYAEVKAIANILRDTDGVPQYNRSTLVSLQSYIARNAPIAAAMVEMRSFPIERAIREAKGEASYTNVRRSNIQNFSFTVRTMADRVILRAMANGKLQHEKVPTGFTGIEKLRTAVNYTRLLRTMASSPFGSYIFTANIFSGDGEFDVGEPDDIPDYGGDLGDMNLGETGVLPLAHVEQIHYESKDNRCVADYFRMSPMALKPYGKKRCQIVTSAVDTLYDNGGVTYKKLAPILEANGIKLYIYRLDSRLIYESKQDSKLKLHAIVSNAHFYVIKSGINLLSQPHKTELMKEDKYEESVEQTRLISNIAVRTDNSHIVVQGTKKVLRKIDYPGTDRDINDIIQLKGSYSNTTTSFYQRCGIQAISYSANGNRRGYRYDLNKAHRSVMSNKRNIFPVSTGLEYYTNINAMSNTIRIVPSNFYEITPPSVSPFKELFPRSGSYAVWCYGMMLSELPACKVNRCFHTTQSTPGRDISHFDNVDVCHYAGNLATWQTRAKTYYNVTDINERGEFFNDYKGQGLYFEQDGLVVPLDNFKSKTGVLAYLAILQLTTLELLRIWKQAGRPTILNVYSDCIELNVLLDTTNKPYKLEQSEFQHIHRPLDSNYMPESFPADIKDYAKDDLSWLGEASALVSGLAGVGKSWYVKNVIMPALDEKKLKYICSSTTLENASAWEAKAIQTLTKKSKGLSNIALEFDQLDYLMVDEISQITMETIHMLQYITRQTKCKLILIGDHNQCISVDGIDYMATDLFKKLYTAHVPIGYHQDSRFTQEYYDFLIEVLASKDDVEHIRELATSRISGTPVIGMNICHTHEHGKTLDSYSTIHSTQGKTLTDVYNFYEINTIHDFRIIYTALSRACNFDGLRVIPTTVKKAPVILMDDDCSDDDCSDDYLDSDSAHKEPVILLDDDCSDDDCSDDEALDQV